MPKENRLSRLSESFYPLFNVILGWHGASKVRYLRSDVYFVFPVLGKWAKLAHLLMLPLALLVRDKTCSVRASQIQSWGKSRWFVRLSSLKSKWSELYITMVPWERANSRRRINETLHTHIWEIWSFHSGEVSSRSLLGSESM